MPTKSPRLHVVLEPPLFSRVKGLAKRHGLSLSLEARQLIREALHVVEGPRPHPYTGSHFGALVGRYRLGRLDPEETLTEAVHGVLP